MDKAREIREDAKRQREGVEQAELENGGIEAVPMPLLEDAYRPDQQDIDAAQHIIRNAYIDQYVYGPIAKVHWTFGAANAARSAYSVIVSARTQRSEEQGQSQ